MTQQRIGGNYQKQNWGAKSLGNGFGNIRASNNIHNNCKPILNQCSQEQVCVYHLCITSSRAESSAFTHSCRLCPAYPSFGVSLPLPLPPWFGSPSKSSTGVSVQTSDGETRRLALFLSPLETFAGPLPLPPLPLPLTLPTRAPASTLTLPWPAGFSGGRIMIVFIRLQSRQSKKMIPFASASASAPAEINITAVSSVSSGRKSIHSRYFSAALPSHSPVHPLLPDPRPLNSFTMQTILMRFRFHL